MDTCDHLLIFQRMTLKELNPVNRPEIPYFCTCTSNSIYDISEIPLHMTLSSDEDALF